MNDVALSHKRRVFILFICCISILMAALDVTALNVALPSIRHELHASISGAQWTIDAYLLVIGSLLIMAGSTGDRIGRKRVFQIGLIVFTAGSLLCSVAPSLNWLIAFRALQAIGGSMLNPVAMSIITSTFTDPKERARAIGAWSGTAGISLAAGPILGGVLVDTLGWRAIFWLNVPIGIAAVVLTGLFVPESKAASPRRPDVIGQILVIGLLSSLVYGIIEAPGIGWTSPFTIGCLCSSVLLFGVFVFYEMRRREPLIDPRFFRSAPFSGSSIIAVAAFAALGGFLFLSTLFLQDARGYSAIRAGLYMLPMAAAMMIIGPASGFIVGRYGARIPLIAGAIAESATAILFAVSGTGIPDVLLLVGFALVGTGLGFLNAALTNTAISSMPRSQAGVAAGITSTMRQVGQSLGVAIIGSILATYTTQIATSPAFAQAWQICWWLLAGFGLTVLVVAIVTTGAWGRRTAESAAYGLAD